MSSIRVMRLRFLLWLGYRIMKCTRVAMTWNGEIPPDGGYRTECLLVKGRSFRRIGLIKINPDDFSVIYQDFFKPKEKL